MSAPATALPQTSDASADADWARSWAERQLQVLGDLAESGLCLAQAIERQVTEPVPDAPLPAPETIGMAFSRVARAVRLTIALQSKVIADLQAWEAGAAQARAEADRKRDHGRIFQKPRQKARVERIVGRIAWAEHDDVQVMERLMAEAGERLDDEDIYGDILARPFSEIVADICRDLGLAPPDWEALAQEPWARDEISSGQVGAPLAPFSPPGRRVGDEGVFGEACELAREAIPPPSPHFSP